MTTKPRIRRAAAVMLAVLIAGASMWLIQATAFAPKTITAYFSHASAIYPGDEVRVSGVKVGTIDAIEPQGTQSKVTMHINRTVPVPENADAILVAPNLVAARYIQLVAPSGPSAAIIADGAQIPLNRTAVPIEWDEVKQQLMRLATELGPHNGVSTTSAARFINSAAGAMNGNGDKLRQTLAQLSGVGRILADGSRRHRRHPEESTNLRQRAQRQQRSDRPIPGSLRHAHQRAGQQSIRTRCRTH